MTLWFALGLLLTVGLLFGAYCFPSGKAGAAYFLAWCAFVFGVALLSGWHP